MRDIVNSSIAYVPELPPENTELYRYLYNEFQRISAALSLLAEGHLDEVHIEPKKPRKGDIRLADGTNWNPGSGSGIYYYNGSLWSKL